MGRCLLEIASVMRPLLRGWWAAAGLLAIASAVAAATPTGELIGTINAVGREGQGNREASRALQAL